MTNMTQYGEVVYFDGSITAVTWNGSATYNVWVYVGGGEWTNVDLFTNPSASNFGEAHDVAVAWIEEIYMEWLD
jgi:hypothetical protein